jgi:hypothetical protein
MGPSVRRLAPRVDLADLVWQGLCNGKWQIQFGLLTGHLFFVPFGCLDRRSFDASFLYRCAVARGRPLVACHWCQNNN